MVEFWSDVWLNVYGVVEWVVGLVGGFVLMDKVDGVGIVWFQNSKKNGSIE